MTTSGILGALVNQEAEEALLGAVILSADARDRALPLVESADFSVPTHAEIFTAIRDLHEAGEPVDAVTVAERWRQFASMPEAVSGEQLVKLSMSVPSPASATTYARAVVRQATSRRIHDLCLATAAKLRGGDDPYDTADSLSEFLEAVDAPVDESRQEAQTLDDLLAAADDAAPWVISGLMRRDWRCVIVAGEGQGKAQRLDMDVPTPDGWAKFGDLVAGDRLFDGAGRVCTVMAVSPVDLYPDAWTVVFSDGTEIEAHAQHEWATVDYYARQRDHAAKAVSTTMMRATLRARGGHTVNHAVPVAGPLELPDADLPIAPYTLGVWLGDGATANALLTLNRDDADEIEARIGNEGWRTHRVPSSERGGSVGVRASGLQVALRGQGLLGYKHVPDAYLRASAAQRKDLLRGLMDTDGFVVAGAAKGGRGSGSAQCELTFMTKALVPGAVELIRSLGINPQVSESDAVLDGRVVGRRWRMRFVSPFNPFAVARKASRWIPPRTRRTQYRYVVDVRRAEPRPMRCIEVDSPDGTYLCDRRMVPTHNSTLLRQLAVLAAQGLHPLRLKAMTPIRSLIVDLENPIAAIAETGSQMVGRLCGTESYDPARCRIFRRPQGLDLRTRHGRGELEREIVLQRPDLVCVGPAYKLIYRRSGRSGAESHEEATEPVLRVLDDLRTRYRFALVIEHHGAKAQGGYRSLDPYGSQRWLAWPELGLSMRPDKDGRTWTLERHRGDRLANDWPDELIRDVVWPWAGRWS